MSDLTEYTWYYCKMKDGDIRMLERGIDYFLSGDMPLLNNEVKEVLAPVPSYEELERTKKQLEIAVNGLERVNNISNNQEKGIQSLVNQIVSCWLASHSALKQIEELEK